MPRRYRTTVAGGYHVKVLVTGGAGYIGSVVVDALYAANHEVAVLDNLSKGHRDALSPDVDLHVVDLLDGPEVRRVLSRGFDAVMHFAACSLVGESVDEPVRYFRTNLGGTLNLLDAMRSAGVRRLVFSSTAAVYGEPVTTPIVETDPTVPTNPYGASKLAADEVIRFESATCGLAAVTLRYFNVAGASGRCGERHDPETHLIPLVLEAALGTRAAVNVYGTDYETSDGTAVRDYIHVEDLARAHLLALDATALSGHRVYNLGNGSGYSVRHVIDVARAVTGRDISVKEADRRSGDPAVLVASSDRVRADLGWWPRKPALEDMVRDAWTFAKTG
jgi:UDP-glucose 4-epimerase